MRKTLAVREGEVLPDGRRLLEGSLHLGPEVRVPITWALDKGNFKPLGWASMMERRHPEMISQGVVEVSFDMVMSDEDFVLDMYEAYPFCTDLVERKVDLSDEDLASQTIVGNARIRCIQLVPIPGIAFGATKPPKPPNMDV